MSQAAMMREMDADIMSAFVDAGLGDDAVYSLGETSTPVRCLIDLDAATAGEYGGVGGTQVQVTLFLAEVTPRKAARVTIDGPPAQVYELISRVSRDQSSEVWQAEVV